MASQSTNSTTRMNTIQLCGSSTGPCGYCNGSRAHLTNFNAPNCSKAYGLLCSSLSPDLYEALLYKGWRRSGTHIYKPDNWNSCCPALTIRLDTNKFQPTRSQRKVLSKLERALRGNTIRGGGNQQKRRNQQPPPQVKTDILQQLQTATLQCLMNIVPAEYQSLLAPDICRFKVKTSNNNHTNDSSSVTITLVCMACAALFGKSKGRLKRDDLARELTRALQDSTILESMSGIVLSITCHTSSGQVFVTLSSDALITEDPNDGDEMSISSSHPANPVQEWLQTTQEPPYKLTITTLAAHESSLQPDVHKLYFSYQQAVHGDRDPLSKEPRPEENENDEEDEEDWGDASQDYIAKCKNMISNQYRKQDCENMDVAFSGFYRFLVESPMKFDGTYGTVHQQYRIEGKLVAVGVVDLLPNGISSVYAFYDPSQHFCAFGKYMSLQEIEFALPRYYYLGYYIESCPKMRYKAEYKPSELLCPTTFQWVDAAQAQAILIKTSPQHHCCTLYKGENHGSNDNDTKGSNGTDVNGSNETQPASTPSMTETVNQLRLNVGASTLVTLKMLQGAGQAVVQPILESFVQEMGPELSRRFILKLV